VSIVIFDSQAPVGMGGERAVYMSATASELEDDEIERGVAVVYPGPPERGGRAFSAAEVRPPSPYRLYRARVTEHSVLCPRPAGEPCVEHGLAYDHRARVDLA